MDGCAKESEPGYDHMEWLRVQLGFMRQRGLKVILIGHVPPARTDSKNNWDESCWQKYALWLRQYRDIIVASMYGHMNIDHFILQDFDEVSIADSVQKHGLERVTRPLKNDSVALQSAGDYLVDLKDDWSKLPTEPTLDLSEGSFFERVMGFLKRKKKHKKHKSRKKYLDEIGGDWAERYAVSQVSPSVIPNYFPTLRIFEYNISGLETAQRPQENENFLPAEKGVARCAERRDGAMYKLDDAGLEQARLGLSDNYAIVLNLEGEKQNKKKKKGKKKRPSLTVPDPPPSDAPPGPAYSPQALTLLGYTQFYANLTAINEHVLGREDAEVVKVYQEPQVGAEADQMIFSSDDSVARNRKHIEGFTFEIEYNTGEDRVFGLKDLTVRSYLRLAERIGSFDSGCTFEDVDEDKALEKKSAEDTLQVDDSESNLETKQDLVIEASRKRKKHKKKKGREGRERCRNDTWLTFIKRAFVGTKDDAEIEKEYG